MYPYPGTENDATKCEKLSVKANINKNPPLWSSDSEDEFIVDKHGVYRTGQTGTKPQTLRQYNKMDIELSMALQNKMTSSNIHFKTRVDFIPLHNTICIHRGLDGHQALLIKDALLACARLLHFFCVPFLPIKAKATGSSFSLVLQ
ncbi:hypothetical protein RF11_06560 [Thelohanellus kitauei]|uniref:Uncharacterized protein n=1 Tax=Thelohanellus kitauei TaxID=669202 RepID=A0A0C2N5V0_THEKT|nr:hypothetical protein RF11_06560 [Thelohanellus kitauei]